MPNLTNWLKTNRANDAAARIADKPTSIKFARGKPTVTLPPQTVRVEFNNTTNEIDGDGGAIVSVQEGRIFALPDADIQKGDRFSADGVIYRVLSITVQTGEIQALFQATS